MTRVDKMEFLTKLPKEAWFAFGTIATVFSTFVIGLLGIKSRKNTARDSAHDSARAELSSSQREFIKALQDEMSGYHAKMADMEQAYQSLRRALDDERESCDRKMQVLQSQIESLKSRMANEESR